MRALQVIDTAAVDGSLKLTVALSKAVTEAIDDCYVGMIERPNRILKQDGKSLWLRDGLDRNDADVCQQLRALGALIALAAQNKVYLRHSEPGYLSPLFFKAVLQDTPLSHVTREELECIEAGLASKVR